MLTPILVASGLWTLWLLSWLLAARWSARTVVRQPLPQRLAHLALLTTGGVLLFGHPAGMPLLQRPLYPLAPGVAWTAVVLMATGFGFAWWARLHLGRLWSGQVTLKADHALIQTGPYRVTRHPIYTGLLLSLAATAVIQDEPSAMLGLAVVLGGLLFKIRQEDRLLAAHFGPAYTVYRAIVPAVIPGLW